MTKDELIKKFVQHIFYQKGYLYWPPGPMMGQVFDKERCEKDVRNFLDEVVKFQIESK